MVFISWKHGFTCWVKFNPCSPFNVQHPCCQFQLGNSLSSYNKFYEHINLSLWYGSLHVNN
jgi:hypothetical protein